MIPRDPGNTMSDQTQRSDSQFDDVVSESYTAGMPGLPLPSSEAPAGASSSKTSAESGASG